MSDGYASQRLEHLKELTTVTEVAATGMMMGTIDTAIDNSELIGFSRFLGNYKHLLNGVTVADQLAQGNNEQALRDAVDIFTGEILEAGYGHILNEMTRPEFAQRYGYANVSPDLRLALNDRIASLAGDFSPSAGEALLDGFTVTPLTPEDRRVRGIQRELTDIEVGITTGNLRDHSHFREIYSPYVTENPDNQLFPWNERPTGRHLDDKLIDATNTVSQGMIDDPNWSITVSTPPVIGLPGIPISIPIGTQRPESLSEFVDIERAGQSPRINFSLDVGDEFGVNLRPDINSHVAAYLSDARTQDNRSFDANDAMGLAGSTINGADFLSLELNDRTNPAFIGGHFDVSENSGGTVVIARDGANVTGSRFGDVILDGSRVSSGAGNDVVILDNELEGYAEGENGNDFIVGGRNNDHIRGGRGRDYLNGGAGDDLLISAGHVPSGSGLPAALTDDREQDILVGGKGVDTYYAGDKDIIRATDGEDKEDTVYFMNVRMDGPSAESDTGQYGERYSLAEDGTTMTIEFQNKTLTIENFQEGDFGMQTPFPNEIVVTGRRQVSSNETDVSTDTETTIAYMRDNSEQMLRNLDIKMAAGTLTPQEEALSGILQRPESASVFANLRDSGITSLNVSLDETAQPEHNGINIYRAVSEAVNVNHIEIEDAQTVQQSDYQAYASDPEHDYGIV